MKRIEWVYATKAIALTLIVSLEEKEPNLTVFFPGIKAIEEVQSSKKTSYFMSIC